MNEIKKSILINCPVSKAFLFHSDTNNLKKITPDSIKVKILRMDLPLKEGSEIGLEIKQFGFLKNKWQIRLTAFIQNSLITDTQISGPFKSWVHDHIFDEAEGKTKMTDRIRYELPFGVLGNIADKILVNKMIEKQFEFRHKITKKLLES
ncbi:MAG TPA: SRPBCC family protein [Ignavibacteria bacterium]|nr:SRPBCC family protein [Ignavibacteria bacterium]